MSPDTNDLMNRHPLTIPGRGGVTGTTGQRNDTVMIRHAGRYTVRNCPVEEDGDDGPIFRYERNHEKK